MQPPYSRSATLALAFIGLAFNVFAAFNLFRLWKSLRWEAESEWEASEKYRLDGVRIVWCLLSAYFSLAAMACVVGLVGVVKRVPSYVRLYRDYSVADLCLCAVSTIIFALASFRPVVRSAVCEELSRQPDLMRDLAEAGLNVENCESWFEHAVVAGIGLMAVLLVIRLQFTLTISSYYSQLLRSTVHGLRLQVVRQPHAAVLPSSPRRIFLLPNNARPPTPTLVYAPVPLNSISEEDARELDATEAWVSPPVPHHHHHRSHRRSSGRISLPIRPDEPLLPSYDADPKH